MFAKDSPKRRKKETFTISFRVDANHLKLLEKGASSYGLSVHEYARMRLLEALDRQDETRILEEATGIKRSVEGLRDDVAATLEVILMNTTKAATPEDQGRIRQWINQYLRRGE